METGDGEIGGAGVIVAEEGYIHVDWTIQKSTGFSSLFVHILDKTIWYYIYIIIMCAPPTVGY